MSLVYICKRCLLYLCYHKPPLEELRVYFSVRAESSELGSVCVCVGTGRGGDNLIIQPPHANITINHTVSFSKAVDEIPVAFINLMFSSQVDVVTESLSHVHGGE